MALVFGAAPWMSTATASAIEPVGATLPTKRDAMAQGEVGGKAYLLGGWEEPGQGKIDQIVRYDPGADTVTIMAAHLPTARHWAAGASDGTHVYAFGGYDSQHRDQILRYDPATDDLVVLGAKLPKARSVASAVWAGDAFLVFGGNNGVGAFLDDIVRFDPATGGVRTMDAKLPAGRDGTSAVFDGTSAFIFGGDGTLGRSDDILRYDPVSDTLEVLGAALPSARSRTAAVWDGSSAWIYGGHTATAALDDVLRFVPATGEVSEVDTPLPKPRINAAAVRLGDANYILGGRQGEGAYFDDILRHTPFRPSAPTAALAQAGPASGDITLTWRAPPGAEADGVTAYRIYRSLADGQPALLAEVDAATLRYVDTGLELVHTYYYRVSAVGLQGEGPTSRETCSPPFPAHLLPSIERPCAPPAGWSETVLAATTVPAKAPLAPNLVEVHGAPRADDPRFYDLDVQVNGAAVPTLHLFTDGAFGMPIDAAVPAPVRSASVSVEAAVRSDPSQPVCLVGVGSVCPETLPFTLGNGWATSLGPKAELVLWVRPMVDGAEAPGLGVRVPFVGQGSELIP